MPTNNYASANNSVVLPIVHPNGEVHNIAVPEDTPMEDFHSALVDSGYAHPTIESKQSQPKADNAVENSAAFREAARKAWEATTGGQDDTTEASFYVDKNGNPGPLTKQVSPAGGVDKVTIKTTADSMGVVHTHPNQRIQGPSDADIANAKKFKKTMWVVTRSGLYAVDPGGKTTKVFDRSNWMKEKK